MSLLPPTAAVHNQPGQTIMYGYARNWERGAAAGADTTRGAKREYSRGPLIRRCRFHSDKLSLRGHHTPLTLAERGKLDRWMRR